MWCKPLQKIGNERKPQEGASEEPEPHSVPVDQGLAVFVHRSPAAYTSRCENDTRAKALDGPPLKNKGDSNENKASDQRDTQKVGEVVNEVVIVHE
jgi:hypothetical protein